MSKTTIIYATKDTFVSDSATSSYLNFGKDYTLIVGTPEPKINIKSLIYFDLSSIPANATITSAKLNLYLNSFDSGSVSSIITIKTLNSNFSEYSVTNKILPTSSDLIGSDNITRGVYSSSIGSIVTFKDLTNTVSSWYSNSSTNYGFELSPYNCPSVSFYSREYPIPALRPNLEIEYTVSTPMPTINTTSITETIRPLDLGFKTTIHDMSKTLFFTYSIDNSILANNPKDFVYVTIQDCNFENGIFENIGDELIVNKGAQVTFEVSSLKKYIRLSVRAISFEESNKITITASYKTFI